MGDVLAGAGLFAAVFAAAAAMLWQPSRQRSAAMLVALALIPVLILGDQWNSTEVSDLRDHVPRFAALGVLGLAVVAGLTLLFRRYPFMFPLGVIAALPFRIPLNAGGEEANLLVPLYLVIAGGVLASVWSWWEDRAASSAGGAVRRDRTRSQLLPMVLAGVMVLYALQSVYSEDFSRALQNAAFFYVPFALAFALLIDWDWDRRLLIWGLCVVGAEALAFVLFGFWEYEARHLIWNSEVIQSNDFHTYFRVNSLFWDPNVYGRYLALAITAIVAVVLWTRNPRLVLWLGALAGLLWLGLITTFSQSSFAALLAGLAVLAALRWSLRWTLAACGAAVVATVAFVLAAGGSLKIDLTTERTLNTDTGGRANLISDGIALFGDRPLWGYGSGSFSVAYQEQRTGGSGQLSVSHTEPVTVAAEQGLIGLAAYLTLLGTAFVTLVRGFRAVMPGVRGPPRRGEAAVPFAGGAEDAVASRAQPPSTVASASSVTGPATEPLAWTVGRAAVFACFTALIAHTMAYAGFLEDPLTWVLLAIGGSLALSSVSSTVPAESRSGREQTPSPPDRAPA